MDQDGSTVKNRSLHEHGEIMQSFVEEVSRGSLEAHFTRV